MQVTREWVRERLSWILLSLVAILGIAAGIGDAIAGAWPFVSLEYNSMTGMSWGSLVVDQPALAGFINNLTRIVGFFLVSSGVFALGISVKGYRSGQKWSWYVLWVLPLVLVLTEILEFSAGGSLLLKELYGLSLILSLLGLLLPVKKFIGNRNPVGEKAYARSS